MTGREGFLLVTGSRSAPPWLQAEVHLRLGELSEDARLNHGVQRLTVVHGNASGVDWEARLWAHRDRGWPIGHKPFPAPWKAPCDPERCTPGHRRQRADGTDYCPAQGSYRNGTMVEYVLQRYHVLGAWVQVAAFYRMPNSAGTLDCVRQARARGLPVLEYGNAPRRKTQAPGEEVPGMRPESPPLF